jgi:hypothetical protein
MPFGQTLAYQLTLICNETCYEVQQCPKSSGAIAPVCLSRKPKDYKNTVVTIKRALIFMYRFARNIFLSDKYLRELHGWNIIFLEVHNNLVLVNLQNYNSEHICWLSIFTDDRIDTIKSQYANFWQMLYVRAPKCVNQVNSVRSELNIKM